MERTTEEIENIVDGSLWLGEEEKRTIIADLNDSSYGPGVHNAVVRMANIIVELEERVDDLNYELAQMT